MIRGEILTINGVRVEGVMLTGIDWKSSPEPRNVPLELPVSGYSGTIELVAAEGWADLVKTLEEMARPRSRYWGRRAMFKRRRLWRAIARQLRLPYQTVRRFFRTGPV